jgi:hypothetical protein
MKKILMALAITALAYASAEAQVCKPKTAPKHKKVVHTIPKKQEVCRTVPYRACKISADRKSVSCYQTIDLENLTPLNDQVFFYGPFGILPTQPEQTGMETTIINGAAPKDYCHRNLEKRTINCSYTGLFFLVRDANGNYVYRDANGNYVNR